MGPWQIIHISTIWPQCGYPPYTDTTSQDAHLNQQLTRQLEEGVLPLPNKSIEPLLHIIFPPWPLSMPWPPTMVTIPLPAHVRYCKCWDFLLQCFFIFGQCLLEFVSDFSCIVYVIVLLWGRALCWAEMASSASGFPWGTYDKFLCAFKKVWLLCRFSSLGCRIRWCCPLFCFFSVS